jgi:plastocyanin
MALRVRVLVALALVGLTVAGVALSTPSDAGAATPRVTIIDNDGLTPNMGIDPWTGHWGFAPHHVTVMKGEQVVFDHPASNKRPHNVISIRNGGNALEPQLVSGDRFSSGLAADQRLTPGASWTLDTSTVDPGHYSYYCSLHPWMVGSVTVLPQ